MSYRVKAVLENLCIFLSGCIIKEKGLKVAVLDADITGASIPTAFGINDVKMFSDGKFIYPAVSLSGIQISSANLLIDKPGDPVIWRGPMASNLVLQFYSYVVYGCDVMIIDCPPGTSDIQLSLMQSIPLDGLILAMTPQGLVNLIANKAKKMADMMNIPIIGGVMNMAYVDCPKCHEKIYPLKNPIWMNCVLLVLWSAKFLSIPASPITPIMER